MNGYSDKGIVTFIAANLALLKKKEYQLCSQCLCSGINQDVTVGSEHVAVQTPRVAFKGCLSTQTFKMSKLIIQGDLGRSQGWKAQMISQTKQSFHVKDKQPTDKISSCNLTLLIAAVLPWRMNMSEK